MDISLLRKVMEHIEAFPEQHDQDVWARQGDCGTTACLAGWTVILSGAQPLYGLFREGEAALCLYEDQHAPQEIEGLARKLLGLTEEQADELFWDSETRDELWNGVEKITSGEVSRP